MYARRMFTQYCYDKVVFFIAGLFLILSSLPSSQSRSLWKHTRVVRFVILFFFYPWGGKTERNRDKDQRENERHKPPSLSENVPFSNWKKKNTLFTEQRITRLKQRISIYRLAINLSFDEIEEKLT